jgi:CIC family chloride channel protein
MKRKAVLVMLAVGLLMYGIMLTTGRYYVDGVGYGVIQDILTGHLTAIYLLVLLFGLKLLATCLTLGSGGSGGIFSPALFLGATAGGAFGIILQHLLPELTISPEAFAVAGMAGMVGGATGAAMTAIVMIFEMTLDYSVILPLTITVVLSYGMRTLLSQESIYTLKLVRRGHYMPAALQVNLLQIRCARDAMQTAVSSVKAMDSLETLGNLAAQNLSMRWFLVVDDGQVTGVIPRDYASSAMETERQDWRSVSDVMHRDFIFAPENDKLADIVARMHRPHAALAVVLSRDGKAASAGAVVGIITWEDISQILEESVDLFTENQTEQ